MKKFAYGIVCDKTVLISESEYVAREKAKLDIMELLIDGWKIYHAIANSYSIHYILVKETE